MKIEFVFVTYNRLAYTKLSIRSLLADRTEEFSLTIWDNASTDGTREFISSVKDHRIVKKVFSRTNVGMQGAAKEIFADSKADLVGCIANDALYSSGWTRILAQAHADVDELGQISCWHLGPEYFDENRARHKIQRFGKHQILRHPWTDGTGLVKLKTLREIGSDDIGSTGFGMRLSRGGYVNGFYIPPIYIEHMDYPWSQYFAYAKNIGEWLDANPAAKRLGIRSMEDARRRHRIAVGYILDSPWEVKYYVGWRSKLKRFENRVKGIISGVRDGER